MIIGIPKEIKDHEYRVGATPAMCRALCEAGATVCIQNDAGARIGFSNEHYQKAGATVLLTAKEIYEKAELIIKVKEPQANEYAFLREGLILFCYLHLAPDPVQTAKLLETKIIGIAYETVSCAAGTSLPLLTPMSEIAGRISVQAGCHSLQLANGGKGVLLGGVPGVSRGHVVVIGGGIVGTHAATMALGLGASVSIFDTNINRLRTLDELFEHRVQTLYSTPSAIEEEIERADLVIGAVLIPGATAPKLLTKKSLKIMEPGSVIVDVAIDQGGCVETAKPTTHSNPTYVVDGIVHYCVTNMPGACAKTATQALTNATMPYALELAKKGYKKALLATPGFANGLNVWHGKVCNKPVATALGYSYHDPLDVLR